MPLLIGQTAVGSALCAVLQIYLLVLIGRIILSWVPSLPEPLLPVARFLSAVTDPILLPLRRVIPPLRLGAAALDLSPLIVFFGISWVLMPILCRL
jgi:YggT family protein